MKYFMTIAASDNSGGAGIQQDIKVAEELGYWGLSAITGITVQNFQKLNSIYPVPAKQLSRQIEINLDSFPITAFKIGAVCSDENIKILSAILKQYKPENIVLDTVFAPTSGKAFIKKGSVKLFKEKLLPHVRIITPNRNEISLLAGKEIISLEQGVEVALELVKQYGCSIFIKGGHFDGEKIKEVLIDKNNIKKLKKKGCN